MIGPRRGRADVDARTVPIRHRSGRSLRLKAKVSHGPVGGGRGATAAGLLVRPALVRPALVRPALRTGITLHLGATKSRWADDKPV